MNVRNTAVIAFLCLLSSLLTAQMKQGDYETKWKAIDSLVSKKGLVQSALSEVDKLYTLAKQEKNEAQLIRALIYRINLQGTTREENIQATAGDLEKEIIAASQPARSILQSILAETYLNYFQRHRWQIYNRTKTADPVKGDIASWSIADFHKKMGQLYLSSLGEEKLLQQTKLDRYDPILIKGNTRYLRPTLFDLLAHRALDYFKTDEQDINKPAYAFEIDDPLVYSNAEAFMAHSFKTTDSLSLHFKALLLFQKLIRLHLSDQQPDALIDVDIERLNFVHIYSVTDDKEDQYIHALSRITDHYPNEPAAAEAWYLQAQQYFVRASGYNASPGAPVAGIIPRSGEPAPADGNTSGSRDTANRYGYVKAKEICEKVLAQVTGRDSSEGKTRCEMLLENIQRKELSLQTEKINLPGEPFRSLVSWRNVTQLYVRVIRSDRSPGDELNPNWWQDEYWKKLLQLPVLQTFEQALPETGDYQTHRAEIKIDALPAGEYMLVSSADKDFSLSKNPLTVQYIYISSISYVNNGRDYFVLNRESGQPLAGASVQVWNQRYDYKTNKTVLDRDTAYQADQYGHFLLAQKAGETGNHQQLLEISTAGDHLFPRDQPVSVYYRNEESDNSTDKLRYEKDNLKTFFFTDRSIYRPGQPLYFKGIVVTRDFDTRQAKIRASLTTKVTLYNANGEKVDSLELTTNEFGSYHGKFILPENLLNGEFHIEDDSTGNTSSFNVEEYKRPKFYVEYEKLKGGYRLGDTIRVNGDAKAYAGNNIDGALVKYRVLRKARYPWLYGIRRYGTRSPLPASDGQEIAHGELSTDASGKFTISFAALADRHINKEMDPVFEYKVSADITDLNGETRSGETEVSVGYKSLQLSITRPAEDHLPADSLKELSIIPTNLSGTPEQADVQVTLYKLRSPDRLIRARLWQEPDQFLIPEQDYRLAFPHDEYRDESKKESWARDVVTAASFQLQGEPLSPGMHYTLQGANLPPGWYLIEARAKDQYGQEVKSLRYIELYDGKTGRPASPQYNWAVQQRETAEPGARASVSIGSSAGNLFVIRKEERGTGLEMKPAVKDGKISYLTLDKEKKNREFAVTEADRGGFGVSDIFVKDNRVYTNVHWVYVPWTNKELTIHYTSFRDKTLPGSEEKWQVKISGYKTDKAAAEVLASMYDASLDQFKPHAWQMPDLYPLYIPQTVWNSNDNFTLAQSRMKYINEAVQRSFVKVYDRIIPFTGQQILRIRGMSSLDRTAAPQNMEMALSGGAPGVAVTSDSAPAQYNIVTGKGLSKRMVVSDVQLEEVEEVREEGSSSSDHEVRTSQQPVQVRKDFKETAFFFPDLRTDSAGNISFSFTMPEAVTRWKWLTFAHSRDLSLGYSETTIATQKQLMVQPNAPRFLREGDRMELSTKIVNLTDSELTGQAALQLTDPTNGQTADGWFTNRQPNQYFTVGAGQSAVVSFPLDIPYQYNRPLSYRIVARASAPRPGGGKEEVSDGEEATLPVVSNRMLVTETLPLNMPGDGSRSFKLDKLLQSGSSETLSQYALTVEFTPNPVWYAVQALPYLMEYPYECAEQTFNRFYANALASKIAGSSPRIQQIFATWKTTDTAALLSNLEKNQELKSVLLEETPWVLQGKSESQQKKNIALLFDMARMSRELASSIDKLQSMQSSNGGFVWFKGGPDDRYITQYILTGIGRLRKLNALPAAAGEKIKTIVAAALPYLDQQIKRDYEAVKKQNKLTPLSGNKGGGWIGELAVQYLYMRSSFSDNGIPGDVFPAVNYYRKQAQQVWLQTSKYMQGMIALALYRTGDIRTAKDIMASLQQNAIRDAEKGMYWKGMEGGYYWYQAPVEMQSLLIEAFHEISGNAAIDRDLRTWLLKQKQTHSWTTTKATADACYALLLEGGDWLHTEKDVTIRLGEKTVTSAGEAGTGYFKKVFDGPFVNASMGNITVTMSSRPEKTPASGSERDQTPGSKGDAGTGIRAAGTPAWGAVYWQYFENLDRITPPGGPTAALRLMKKIFVERNTDRGPVLEPVAENGTLHVGDKVKIRIELQADRDLEYVHMKDTRAACMEPVNVLSGYKWQGGLGYYESTKDVSTDFFFSRLPRGTYIFEYPLFVSQIGNFSNGITGIECMYAPEFAFHSEGVRVSVEARNNE